MMFFFKPKGHEESSLHSQQRQRETDLVFPSILVYDKRLAYLERPTEFYNYANKWIATNFLHAIEVFEEVRASLLTYYKDLI